MSKGSGARGRAYVLITLMALAIGSAVVVRSTSAFNRAGDSDLTDIFIRSADHVLTGDVLGMYAVRATAPAPNIPNDDPPLTTLAIVPLVALARGMGWNADLRAQSIAVALPFVVTGPLLGWLGVRAVRRARPESDEVERLMLYGLLVLSPLLWLALMPWGHYEQLLATTFVIAGVLALQARREVLAGLLAGLATLTAFTAGFPFLALGALMAVRREWRPLLRVGGTGVAIVLAGVLPFFIGDRHDTVYALLQFRSSAQIGGNSIWSIFTVGHWPQSVLALAHRLDVPSMALFALGAGYMVGRRTVVSAYSEHGWMLLMLGAMTLPMLVKFDWPYYFFTPYALLLIWEVATVPGNGTAPGYPPTIWRWPALSLAYLLFAATLTPVIGLRSISPADRMLLGFTTFGGLAVIVALSWKRLIALTAETGAAI